MEYNFFLRKKKTDVCQEKKLLSFLLENPPPNPHIVEGIFFYL
jgi:hypothetical protein